VLGGLRAAAGTMVLVSNLGAVRPAIIAPIDARRDALR
jgi:hypothetical protein